MCRTGAVGAMLAPEGRETGCRESTESSGPTGSGSKGGVSLAFKVGRATFRQRWRPFRDQLSSLARGSFNGTCMLRAMPSRQRAFRVLSQLPQPKR